MKKRSIRFITLLLVLSMLFALSLTAFAGSSSFTVKRSGYNCACYLSVSARSASASLDCTLIPGQMGPMDPEVVVDGEVRGTNDMLLGYLFDRDVNSAYSSYTWKEYDAVKATCTYEFMGATIMTLNAAP